jgi:hypothetical protein
MPAAWAVASASAIWNLDAVGDRRSQWKGLLADHLLQGTALDELHGDEVASVGPPDFVDGDDVRMVQRGGRLRFLDEAAPLVVGRSAVGGQEFQRRGPVQQDIAGLVHQAHPALAELFEDLVMADRRPGHGADHSSARKARLVASA